MKNKCCAATSKETGWPQSRARSAFAVLAFLFLVAQFTHFAAAQCDLPFSNDVRFDCGEFPRSLATGDFDNDGNIDIVTANLGSDNMSLLFGKGDGRFEPAQEHHVGTNPSFVITGDFNDDGITDLVFARGTTGSSSVNVRLGLADGTFGKQQGYGTGGNGSWSIAAGDFNSDGEVDLATANRLSDNVSVLVGDGAGNFDFLQTVDVGLFPGR